MFQSKFFQIFSCIVISLVGMTQTGVSELIAYDGFNEEPVGFSVPFEQRDTNQGLSYESEGTLEAVQGFSGASTFAQKATLTQKITAESHDTIWISFLVKRTGEGTEFRIDFLDQASAARKGFSVQS